MYTLGCAYSIWKPRIRIHFREVCCGWKEHVCFPGKPCKKNIGKLAKATILNLTYTLQSSGFPTPKAKFTTPKIQLKGARIVFHVCQKCKVPFLLILEVLGVLKFSRLHEDTCNCKHSSFTELKSKRAVGHKLWNHRKSGFQRRWWDLWVCYFP